MSLSPSPISPIVLALILVFGPSPAIASHTGRHSNRLLAGVLVDQRSAGLDVATQQAVAAPVVRAGTRFIQVLIWFGQVAAGAIIGFGSVNLISWIRDRPAPEHETPTRLRGTEWVGEGHGSEVRLRFHADDWSLATISVSDRAGDTESWEFMADRVSRRGRFVGNLTCSTHGGRTTSSCSIGRTANNRLIVRARFRDCITHIPAVPLRIRAA